MSKVKFFVFLILSIGVLIGLIGILTANYFARGKTKQEQIQSSNKIRKICYIYIASVLLAMILTIIIF